MWREIIYGNRHNVIEGLTQIESEIEHVKAILHKMTKDKH